MTRHVAMVPGGAQGGWVWDELIAALAAQDPAVRAVAHDPPGCGTKRDRDTAGITVAAAAAEIAEDIARAGQRDVLLVGHSNAGTLLPLIAAARPDLVAGLLYVACIAPPSGASVAERMGEPHEGRRQWRADATPEERRAHHRHAFCSDMGPQAAEAFLARLGHDRWPTAAAMAERNWRYDHLAGRPAAYLLCLEDRILPPAWQEEFATRLHATCRIRIDAGHQAMNTRPHGVAEIVRQELAALPVAA